MHADFDLDDSGNVRPSTRGGRREGAGRPKGYSPKRARQIENDDLFGEDEDPEAAERTSIAVRKARAVAEKEEWLAKNQELKFKIDSGEYLSRTAFRQAASTLLAELAQGLRSIPDALERDHSLPPKVLTDVELTVNKALEGIARGLEMFTEQPKPE